MSLSGGTHRRGEQRLYCRANLGVVPLLSGLLPKVTGGYVGFGRCVWWTLGDSGGLGHRTPPSLRREPACAKFEAQHGFGCVVERSVAKPALERGGWPFLCVVRPFLVDRFFGK